MGRAVPGLRVLGFESVLGGDEVLRDLVLARIIEPTSKIDAERVLTETGVAAASYRTVKRRLPADRQTCCPASIIGSVRRACRVGAGQPGALRRVDPVLRNRYR